MEPQSRRATDLYSFVLISIKEVFLLPKFLGNVEKE